MSTALQILKAAAAIVLPFLKLKPGPEVPKKAARPK